MSRDTRKPKNKDLVVPTREELEEEYEEIRKLVVLPEDPKPKKKAGSGPAHHLLPGVQQKAGDRILAIVGMRMQNFRDKEIAEHLGTYQPEISRLEREYPRAFELAETHLLKNAARKHNVLVWGVRHELTKYAARMIKVLVDLAEDANTKENIRHKAAVDVLNMTMSGYARQTYGGEEQQVRKGVVNVVNNTFAGDKEVAISVEAEDAEFVESKDD